MTTLEQAQLHLRVKRNLIERECRLYASPRRRYEVRARLRQVHGWDEAKAAISKATGKE